MQIASELFPSENLSVRYFAIPHSERIVDDYMNILAFILWTQGAMPAYDWYHSIVLGGSFEVAVSHRIEAKAFEGTSWELLFNLICGEA